MRNTQKKIQEPQAALKSRGAPNGRFRKLPNPPKKKLELPIKLASKLLFNSQLSNFRVVEDLILENVPCKSQKTLFPASSASPVSMTG